MNKYPLNFKPFGSNALLIEWPNQIDLNILNEIISLQKGIETELAELIIETINAYNSLTVIFKDEIILLTDLTEKVKQIYNSGTRQIDIKSKTWKIPVCYDEEFGIDLKDIAKEKNCSISEIIEMHTHPKYIVYFTGFLPGFLYLGGLPATLVIPRKSTPRLHIIKGAVAIGGEQTGIYPSNSPGGWNIIGNSPLEFFNTTQNPPCFAQAGDTLSFYAINKAEHQRIKEAVDADMYEIEYENQ